MADENKNSVPQVFIETPEGKSHKLNELIQGEIKNFYRSGVGENDELMMEAWERAAKSWNEKTSSERMQSVVKAMRGDQGEQKLLSVSERAKGHWATTGLGKSVGGVDQDLPYDPIGDGKVMGKALLYIMRSYQERQRVDWAEIAKDARNHGHKQIGEIIEKSLAAGSLAEGGVFVPSVMAADIIPYLEDAAVVRRLGARVVEMPNGNLDFGRINSTVQANWVGETGTANASTIGTDEVRLVAKKLKITVIASNDLLRQSPRGVASMIADMSRERAAAKEDLDMIRANGTAGAPKGIYHWLSSGQKFNATETDLSTIFADIFKAIRLVAENKHSLSRGGWIMALRTKYGYMSQTDGNKNLTPLTEMLSNNQLFGFPVGVTTGLPTNLGTGNDETETYFGDFSNAVIGETLNMRVEEADQATVTDESGNALRLWDEDQRAIRLIHEVDFALRYNNCFSVIEQVGLGS